VDLSTVKNLDSADLHSAVADKNTKWPPGFNPLQAGVTVT